MRAFEIYLNDKKLCVAGLDQGTLSFGIGCFENSRCRGEVGLSMTGMLLLTLETIRWQHRALRINDEVRVRIVESPKSDNYKVLQKAPADERKYEKAYVRRMAKEFGWTIQAGAKRKKTGAS
jgi:lipocalin